MVEGAIAALKPAVHLRKVKKSNKNRQPLLIFKERFKLSKPATEFLKPSAHVWTSPELNSSVRAIFIHPIPKD